MTLSVDILHPVVTENALRPLLGGRRGQAFSNGIKATIRSWKNRFDRVIEPQLAFKMVPVHDISKGRVLVGTDCQLKSPKLSKTLHGCKETVCFLATLGTRIEKEVRRLFKNKRMADAYVLDAMGSAAVENMVDRFQSQVQNTSRARGENVTLRFSPGYCDWSVREQKKLFQIIRPQPIGVKLNPSCLMEPRKSISGIFGILPAECAGTARYNPCKECDRIDCPARRS